MADCMSIDPVKYGVFIHNLSPSGDWADPTIHGCTFTNYRTDRSPDAMVRWESGGGLRFQNNKVNTGPASGGLQGKCAIGLDLAAADGVTTGVFTVGGNSLENCTVAMMRMSLAGPTYSGDLAGMSFVGNEVGFGWGSCVGVLLTNGGANGKLRNVVIDGNQFVNLNGGGIRLENMNGVHIGDNIFTEVVGAPVVHISAGSQDIAVARQTIRAATEATLIQNDEEGTDLNPKGPFSVIDHTYSRALPAVTSTSSWVTIWRFTVSGYSAGLFTLDIDGGVTGVGSMARRLTRSYARDGGLVTVATVGTDVQVGASSLDVQFDTATAGEVNVQVKLPSGSTGTDAAGRATLRIDGVVYQVIRPV
jgi:hypothetical protein